MTPVKSKAKILNELINNKKLEMILEAHNGLSAKIVQDSGFKAVWASGLSIATAFGLRDCNEASWSQILNTVEFMNDSVDIPILFDGDSGFGNFNNVRYIVKKLSSYGIAGISIEDKLFPKLNSFIESAHDLTPTKEFVGKIKAAQDSKQDPSFCVVARTEALIAGLSVDEALERASHYYEAGADAIFIHSKKSDASEILEFAKKWNRQCPLVVAPTTYANVPVEILEQLGITIYICANHLMRASMANMKSVADQIMRERSIGNLTSQISPLSKVFELLDYKELESAEKLYV